MELNPTDVIELISGFDWWAFPLVFLFLMPAILLVANKLLLSSGLEVVAKWKFYLLVAALYLGALVSAKIGAIKEDNFKTQIGPIPTYFERAQKTSMSFDEVKTNTATGLCDKDLKQLALQYSSSFALDGSHGADSLWLVYIDTAGVDRINNSLRPLAVAHIKNWLDTWTGSIKPNITFKKLRMKEPLLTYEFSAWLASQSDLGKDSLKLSVWLSTDRSQRYAFEYK